MEQPFRREQRLWVFMAAVALVLVTWPAGTARAGPFEEGLDFFQGGHYRWALEALGEPALATVQVPLHRRGAAVLLPGTVNGQPVGYFILDTGATFTSLSGLVANRLGISSGGSSVRLTTASGVIQAPLAVLDELDIGGAVARHVPAVIHDLPNAPPSVVGLLGLSFLERFRVNLDLGSGVLLLQSGE